MNGRSLRLLPVLLAAALLPPATAAGQSSTFGVRAVEDATGWYPVVEAQGLLRDPALRGALDAGFPLRFRLRVELWRKEIFDQLAGEQESYLAVSRDPLDGALRFETALGERRFTNPTEAEAALASALRPSLRARGRGRFYYLASLEVESLSLSDLEELRRWLRGEVRPAVEGRAPPGRAVERGLRRVLVRVIGLPTRKYEDRSATFVLR